MIRKQLQAAFLDWKNNYLTVEKYAEHNSITAEQAQQIIDIGRECHEQIVAEWKLREPVFNGIESDDAFRERHAKWKNEWRED